MDPFGTGKIVLFQVSYDKDYHLFELVPFILCAILSVGTERDRPYYLAQMISRDSLVHLSLILTLNINN